MVFHTANKHVAYPKLNVNGNNIERVTNFNFLGLTLSSTLSWNQHINKISLKISKSIGILYRLRDIYPRAVLENLYNALITTHFNYCILCWGSVVKENNSLHILQKRALRLITNSNYISHTEPSCKELRVLKVFDMLSAWPEVRGTADTDGGAYSPFRSILLVLTHDFIIIQLYGPACGDG